MSEMSRLYKVPSPSEINDLLRSDYAVDEAVPDDKALEVGDRIDGNSKVLEVGDRANYEDPVSVVSDIADTYFDTSISTELAEEIIEDLEAMGWRLLKISSIDGETSKVLEVGNSTIKNLITQLYLDLHHIKCLSEVLCQFASSQSPEAIRTVADLINYQAETSLTSCLPFTLINHAGNTTRD